MLNFARSLIHWIQRRGQAFYHQIGRAVQTIRMVMEISDRPRTQQQLQRLNRSLRTLSECNQALVRATDEPTLLQDVCRIVVEIGGYRAAWIGFAEQDESKRVRPVAQAGYSQDYLQSIQITWSDTELGRGPTGTAIRTGQACIAQDIVNDPNYQLWRDAASRCGCASSIALPLIVERQPLGALHIYASHPHAFDAPEVKLLSELANDLAYGIAALRTRISHQQAEVALRDSEAKFRMFLEMASEAVIVSNVRGEIVIFNTKAEEIFGYDHTEVLGCPVECLMPERFRQGHAQFRTGYYAQPSRRSMGQSRNLYARRKDGSEFPIEAGLSSVQIGDERFVLTFLTDITERKQAEEGLRQSEERLRLVLQNMPVMLDAFDAEGNIIIWNQECERVTGYSAAETINNPQAMELMYPDAAYRQQMIAAWIEWGNRYRNWEWDITCKDGSIKTIAWSNISEQFPIPGWAMWGIGIDVTDRKRAEEALRQANQELENRVAKRTAELAQTNDRLQLELLERQRAQQILQEQAQLLDLAHDTIMTRNLDGMIAFWNQGAEQMYGWTKSEAVGQRSHTLLQTQFPQPLSNIEVELLNQGYWEGELIHTRRDGTLIVTASRWVLQRDSDGQPIKVLEINNNITEQKRAEAARSQLAAIVESSQDAIISKTLDGLVISWNAGAEKLFGYTAEEMIGHSIAFLLPADRPDEEWQILEQLKQGQQFRQYETVRRRKDGTLVDISLTVSPVKNAAGEIIGASKIARDITVRKRVEAALRESEHKFRALFEQTFQFIALLKPDGMLLEINQAPLEFSRTEREAVVGRPLWEFPAWVATVELQKVAKEAITQAAAGHFVRSEVCIPDAQGTWTDFDFSVKPIRDEFGQVVLLIAEGRDITDRKRAEEQLRGSNERISLANAELARAARLKDEFLAGMSHELRTPLNAILGLSEVLLEEVYGELTEDQRESLSTIEQSGKHLLDLINDILDLSKVESGRMELEITSIPVRSLCDSSLSFVKQQAHSKKIGLSCQIAEGLTEIEVDPRRIRQVLVNLLSNAVKFTPDGGAVQLQVSVDAFGETIAFSVTDTGIGIAPENINKLFQPFVQLDSSLSRRYAGTGLGLALVRRIVELHGGSVAVESEVGIGSSFTITLPWISSNSLQSRFPGDESAQPTPLNIQQVMIVEDSEPAANLLVRYLQELGATTLIHPMAEGAVEIAARTQPTVILLDILLPDRSGWEVLAQLKANPMTQHIPVIVVSVVDERSRALELGATECLLKPISRQQLQQALNRVLTPATPSDEQKALVIAPAQSPEFPLILLAEDNEANISMLTKYLQVNGLQVILARNGLEAIQMAKQYKPDLILMDIQMPEMDGIEAMYRIRADASLAEIPIIALTALAMPGDREKCLAAGAAEYMTKPVSLRQLARIISEHIPSLHPKEAH